MLGQPAEEQDRVAALERENVYERTVGLTAPGKERAQDTSRTGCDQLERLAVVALAVTDFAGYINIGQELHFNPVLPLALARFAAASEWHCREATAR